MANPVVHFEVVGKDAKVLQDFYGKAFGWKVEPQSVPGYAMVYPGGEEGIDGGIGGGFPGMESGHVTVYVQVPDVEATLKQIESLGGKTISPPMDVPGGPTIAQFADPEGHMIGLIKGPAS